MEASDRDNKKLTAKARILIVENLLDGNDVGLKKADVSAPR
jgi:hypothetical protein